MLLFCKSDIGEGIDRSLEKKENQKSYLFDHNDRILNVENGGDE